MADWRDANYSISGNDVFTPNRGPENAHYDYVWRAEWPISDNSYTWTNFLALQNQYQPVDIVGFIMDDPLNGHPSGSVDPRYYITNGWPSSVPFGTFFGPLDELAPLGTIFTHDNVTGGRHDDWLFLGPGDDRLAGGDGNDYLAGGDGDDLIYGGKNDDTIYGDYVNAPVITNESFGGQVFTWYLPTEADPTVVDGNDELHGEDGGDTIYGGGGNDILDGGPRGSGWTDVLTGGPGSDIFFLSYQTEEELDSEESAWWEDWGEDIVEGAAKGATKDILDKLAETVAKETFESFTGGLILGGLIDGAADSVKFALGQIFGHSPAVPPPPTTEDVMVVTDFDPRVDVLFLPLEENTSLIADGSFFASAAVPGLSGWGAKFSSLDKVFAEVFLDTDFLAEFDLKSGDAASEAFIENIFSASLEVTSEGTQEADNVYPYSDDDSDYTSGVAPDGIAETLALAAPDGAATRIFGAFAPQVVYGPAISIGTTLVSGTDMGDILSVNRVGFAPEDYLITQLSTLPSIVKGFGGDDIIFGGSGQDILNGGDGDDDLYAFQTLVSTSGPLTETLEGEAGDDILYVGGTAAHVDGGDGNDTASFALSPFSAEADLASGTAKDTGTNTGGVAPNTGNVYTLVDIENVTGTFQDDRLTGDSGDNILQGGAGSDTLDGGGGSDTLSYADNPGKVAVTLPRGPAQEFGANSTGDANTVVSTDTLLSDFTNVIGSAFDDTLVGDGSDNLLQGNAGSDSLDGGAGDDTASYADNFGAVSVDLETGTASEYAETDTTTSGAVSTDVLANIENIIGTEFDDILVGNAANNSIIGGEGDDFLESGGGVDTLDGGDGNDTASFANASTGATVDLSDVNGPVTNIESLIGSASGDSLTGDDAINVINGGDGNDAINAAGGNDTLTGGSGNDTIADGAGVDIVNGGAGNDTYVVGAGNDTIDDSGGIDTLDFSNAIAALKVNLNFGGGNQTSAIVGTIDANGNVIGDENRVTFATFENVIGTRFNDSIESYSADSIIDGGSGNDTIRSFQGNDTLSGGAGNDSIISDPTFGVGGKDSLVGGDGNDTLSGIKDNDTLTGGSGDDWFSINSDRATITITDFVKGEDLIELPNSLSFGQLSFTGSSILVGTQTIANLTGFDATTLTQSDFTYPPGETDVADEPITDGGGGSSGHDYIFGSHDADTLAGGSGNDTLNGNGGEDDINGGSGDDELRGDAGDDFIRAGSGNDTVTGGDGDDTVLGGSGDDELTGAGGNDILNGDNGNDTILAGSGDDTADGGFGNDVIQGQTGDDSLSGFSGMDTVTAGDGNDTVHGGGHDDRLAGDAGDDILRGANGDDEVYGGSGNDTLIGNKGDDVLMGGEGADTLLGSIGDDILRGGEGNDLVVGGDGDDIFVLAEGEGRDRILDFQNGADLFGLADGLSYEDITFDGEKIETGYEILAVVVGVDTSTLNEFDFIQL
jgi:Ca2+-binding RTX toxin-like protein